MRERCEVCENHRPNDELPGDRNTRLVVFGEHPVVLCAGHAKIAQNSGVTSFEGLRELYGTGRRSFVPRRSRGVMMIGDERRADLRHPGRRATDARKKAS